VNSSTPPGLRWFVLAATVALAPVGAHQSPPPPTTIDGRVVDALTSRPVRGAVVRANASAFRTGQDGRFVLRVAAGVVTLRATKTGYLDGEAQPIELAESDQRRDVVVRLTPEGVISGRVVDQSGTPVERATVHAVARDEANRDGAGISTVTDDVGNYMIGGLGSGEFLVRVNGGTTGLLYALHAYPAVYFPAAASQAEATAIHVAAGAEQRGIDFQLRLEPFTAGTPRLPLFADGPAAGTIAGVVRDSTGRGLARASVVLATTDLTEVRVLGIQGSLYSTLQSTSTDEHGRFQFAKVPPGRLTLLASRPECVAAGGLMTYKRTPVQLEPGQRRVDIAIALPDSGMLTGTLTDEFGDPVAAVVFLSEWHSWSTGPPARADPKGRFRFGCLSPGDYRLTVDQETSVGDLQTWSSGADQTVALLPVYYPGVSDPTLAAPLSVRAGADSGGFTIVVRPAPVTTIDVTIDSGGREISNGRLMRLALDDRWDGAVRISSDGRRLESVPAGRFMLVADGEDLQGNIPVRLYATQQITTDGVTPLSVTLALQAGGRVSGRLAFEGAAKPPAALGALLVSIGTGAMGSLSGTQRNATIDQRDFSIADVLPGQYLLRVNQIYPSSHWMLKSITMGNQNILDRPVEITSGADLSNVVVTFTDRITEISGTVTDATGKPVPLEAVVVFPADSSHWRQPSLLTFVGPTDASGRYRITGVPPGEYRVGTAQTVEKSPSLFSKLLPMSVVVAIAPGDRKIVNLTR
jgi:Carboxypeptidase regulatory-like domain